MPPLVQTARAWVTSRPRSQQTAGVVGLALAITAPFGGLAQAEEDIGHLRASTEFSVGPFAVRIDRVLSFADLAPTASPSKPGDRLLVVVATVTNTDDQPQFSKQLTDSFHALGPAIVPDETGSTAPELVVVADETTPSILNPDVAFDVVLIFEHSTDLGDEVTLAMQELTYVEEGALTLQDDYWRSDDRLSSRGEFEVEVKE